MFVEAEEEDGKMVTSIHKLLVWNIKKVIMMIQPSNFFLSDKVFMSSNKKKNSILRDFYTTVWLLSVDKNVIKYIQHRLTSS